VNLHEYQARGLLKAAGVPMPDGDVASTPAEAEAIATLFDDRRSFAVDRSHVTITGRCATCTAAEAALAD